MGQQVREPLPRLFGRRKIRREVVLLRDRLESPVTNRPASIAVGGRSASQDDLHPSAPRARGIHRVNLQLSQRRPWQGVGHANNSIQMPFGSSMYAHRLVAGFMLETTGEPAFFASASALSRASTWNAKWSSPSPAV